MDGYRQNGPSEFEKKRQEHLRQRLADLAVQVALLESEQARLKAVLGPDA